MKVGTEVRFLFRGKPVVGVVAGYHLKQRRGRVRQLAELVTGNPSSLDIEQLVIVSTTENTYWRVSNSGDLRPTGKVVTTSEAALRLRDVKHAIKRHDADRRQERVEASGVRWWSVREGTVIEVKFSDIGWTKVTYCGTVAKSGNVRFNHRGRIKTISPKFARLVEVQG